ncbi:hypothetical protein IT412_03630 [Candidatus Peregrinibacteria bacterium]|nr:hypothetical protein [Candidatus Peregrinibacteria bacterium]
MGRDLEQLGDEFGLDDVKPEEVTPVPASVERVTNRAILSDTVESFSASVEGLSNEDKRAAFLDLKNRNPEVARQFQQRQLQINAALNADSRAAITASAESRGATENVLSIATGTQVGVVRAIVGKIRRSA